MNDTDKKLYELLGDKHEPTIAGLHRLLRNKGLCWGHYPHVISVGKSDIKMEDIDYDSSKSLLLQSEETKLAIISLIESYAKS